MQVPFVCLQLLGLQGADQPQNQVDFAVRDFQDPTGASAVCVPCASAPGARCVPSTRTLLWEVGAFRDLRMLIDRGMGLQRHATVLRMLCNGSVTVLLCYAPALQCATGLPRFFSAAQRSCTGSASLK